MPPRFVAREVDAGRAGLLLDRGAGPAPGKSVDNWKFIAAQQPSGWQDQSITVPITPFVAPAAQDAGRRVRVHQRTEIAQVHAAALHPIGRTLELKFRLLQPPLTKAAFTSRATVSWIPFGYALSHARDALHGAPQAEGCRARMSVRGGDDQGLAPAGRGSGCAGSLPRFLWNRPIQVAARPGRRLRSAVGSTTARAVERRAGLGFSAAVSPVAGPCRTVRAAGSGDVFLADRGRFKSADREEGLQDRRRGARPASQGTEGGPGARHLAHQALAVEGF